MNAGGNHTYPTYMLNPQWHLRILEQELIRRSVSPAIGPSSSRELGTWQGPGASAKDKAAVILSALGPREMSLNLTAVWSSGERVVECVSNSFRRSDNLMHNLGLPRERSSQALEHILMDMLERLLIYHVGVSLDASPLSADRALKAGDYSVILSAFEPQIHLGAFTVKVESSRKFELTPIPQEGAGMYTRVTKGEWWVFLMLLLSTKS